MNRLLIIGILLVSTVASYAYGTQPDIAKLKADAQKVVSIIKGDNRPIREADIIPAEPEPASI